MVTHLRTKATRLLLVIAAVALIAGTTIVPSYAEPFNSTGTTGH